MADREERDQRYVKADNTVRSAAGAVPIRNAKGEMVMEKVKVGRYRPGKVPEYAIRTTTADSDDDSDEGGALLRIARHKAASAATESDALDQRLRQLEEAVEAASTGRQRRRPTVEAAVSEGSDSEDGLGEGSSRQRAPIVAAVEDEDEEDDEEIENRRQRMRDRARARAAEEEAEELAIEDEDNLVAGNGLGSMAVEDEDEESESESEYETDSSDDAPPAPVFVSKAQRATLQEREALEQAAAAAAAAAEEKQKQRELETRQLVAKTMQDELDAEHRLAEMDIDDVDDAYNDEEEYAAWKVRELSRLKRDRDKREQEEAERLEVERLRSMTEEERLAVLKEREKATANNESKGKMKFMQKYYHRGAFFMDEDEELYKRDVTAPTGDDNFDKSVLPKAMQVRKDMFGKMSQTKYTHLGDQDTSRKDSAWNQKTPVNARMEQKRAGAKNIFERPSGKRKRE